MLAKLAVLATLVPSILAANFAVTVGLNNALSFTPTTITADVGDTITFTVVSRNHSVTTTNFSGAVCPPPVGGVGPNGFDSGFLSDLDGSQPTFTYTVVDTVPHFGACMQAAGAHCRAGMTFAINPNATFTYAQFLANAKAS
ncbi:Cupredoxin [Mycena amicta]|nr:Cupredoxin [Mycena amicta]